MLLKRKTFLFILFFILVGLAGCSREKAGSAPPNPNVIASYNGGVITKDQLKARLDGLMPCCKGRYQGKEGTEALIKEMVLPTAISQAIKQKKIDLRGNIRRRKTSPNTGSTWRRWKRSSPKPKSLSSIRKRRRSTSNLLNSR